MFIWRLILKIAILTINDYDNYGNRLQNFALQELLKSLGHEVLTVKNFYVAPKKKSSTTQKLKKLINYTTVKNKIKKTYKNKLENYNSRKYADLDLYRKKKFHEFTDEYIRESKKSYSNISDDFEEFDDIDCFVIGSDQVWNYNFSRFSKMDFGLFTDKPKISYAASFGVSSVPEKLVPVFKEGLEQLTEISVREQAGKSIVGQLTHKKAEVVLDPTLLLDQSEWLGLIKKSKNYQKKYLLTYFLSEPSQETKKYIKKIAQEKNWQIKQLATRKDQEVWTSSPAEFVNLFSQAEYVLTDSFHACVFSVIFEKNFEVFERQGLNGSMNSRMDTLLSDLHLTNRWHKSRQENKPAINYHEVQLFLKDRQKQSLKFLDVAFKKVENNKKNHQ